MIQNNLGDDVVDLWGGVVQAETILEVRPDDPLQIWEHEQTTITSGSRSSLSYSPCRVKKSR